MRVAKYTEKGFVLGRGAKTGCIGDIYMSVFFLPVFELFFGEFLCPAAQRNVGAIFQKLRGKAFAAKFSCAGVNIAFFFPIARDAMAIHSGRGGVGDTRRGDYADR